MFLFELCSYMMQHVFFCFLPLELVYMHLHLHLLETSSFSFMNNSRVHGFVVKYLPNMDLIDREGVGGGI